jgi:hypothetical protein
MKTKRTTRTRKPATPPKGKPPAPLFPAVTGPRALLVDTAELATQLAHKAQALAIPAYAVGRDFDTFSRVLTSPHGGDERNAYGKAAANSAALMLKAAQHLKRAGELAAQAAGQSGGVPYIPDLKAKA